jgi:RNA polymerase sigma-70 factor (ECF subfamily)
MLMESPKKRVDRVNRVNRRKMEPSPLPLATPPRIDPVEALTDLIRAQRGMLVRVARREGLSPEDAVEVAQEALSTFLQIIQRGEAPVKSVEWPAFVTTIAKNAARNRRRRHHVAAPHQSIDTDNGSVAFVDESPSAEDLLAEAEEHVRLRACVERLCGTQKSVVMLRLLEERAGEDVAAVLGITRGHVDVLLHRAKASLRECMME